MPAKWKPAAKPPKPHCAGHGGCSEKETKKPEKKEAKKAEK